MQELKKEDIEEFLKEEKDLDINEDLEELENEIEYNPEDSDKERREGKKYFTYTEEEYMTMIRKKYGISDDVTYDKIYETFEERCSSNFRHITVKEKFSWNQLTNLVLTYQKQKLEGNPDELLFLMIHNMFLPVVVKISKRYIGYGIVYRRKGVQAEHDYYQESFIILVKCLERFKAYEDKATSFASYYSGELKNHFIETTRKKYFEIMKMPSTRYREYRKETIDKSIEQIPMYYKMKEELMTTVIVQGTVVTEDKEMEMIRESSMLQEAAQILLDEKTLKPSEIMILFLNLGIGGSIEYTMHEISIMFGISNSLMSKRFKIVKEKMKNSEKFHNFLIDWVGE